MHTEWNDFFLAEVGAAAALAGLIFVAVSLNVDRILEFPWLPTRAGSTIAGLIAALVYGAMALLPDQALRPLGIEVLVVSVVVWAVQLRQQHRARRQPGYNDTVTPWVHVVLDQCATAPAVIAGVLLVADAKAGLWVLAFAVLVIFVVAVTNAWVLLVEVRR